MVRTWTCAALFLLSTVVVGLPAHAQQVGCYLSFDGIDDRVEIASGAFPLFEYTLSAWVRTAGSAGLQVILSRGEDATTDVLPWGFGLLGTGVVYLQIENAADTSHEAYPGVTAVDDGGWHHVAATRMLDGTAKLYVDGLLDATHATPATGGSSQTVGMGFTYQDSGGAAVKPPVLFWDGSLDELTLWSVALNDSAIADLAANGVPASPTGLVAHWDLDEGTGQTATDSAPGALHPGTLGATAGADASDPGWVCATGVSNSVLTGGQGCDSPTCTTPTHTLGPVTGGGDGLLELSGGTLDFRVGIGSATFTPVVCPTPIFEFSDVVYSGIATVDTVGSTHTITLGTALISGNVNVGEVVCPNPFTTSALDVSGSCEGAGSALSCGLTFLLTDPAFDVGGETALEGGQPTYFVHTVTASGASSVPAGRVPDGSNVAELPLTVALAGGGEITLSWDASCSGTDTDYEIYEGTLGNFTSHAARFCSTGGAISLSFPPAEGSTYYLVVPRTATREGSYGTDSNTVERPQGDSACITQAIAACP